MKKIKRIAVTGIAILLLILLMGVFPSCEKLSDDNNVDNSQDNVADEPKEDEKMLEDGQSVATVADAAALEAAYADRNPYYGDIHCHPDAGVSWDGEKTLAEWKIMMKEKKLDFVAFMNHHQVAHMYEEEWDDTMFIGGTEPATVILDSKAEHNGMHYNMLFADPLNLLDILRKFPEYNYTGGKFGNEINMGTFDYAKFETARFQELIAAIKRNKGLFVHVHPKDGYMQSDDPLDYYFADYTGLEVLYTWYGDHTNPDVQRNVRDAYKLWTDLLAAGKRVWATAGSDTHIEARDTGLTCVYSEEKLNTSHMSHLANGDFVAGGVGIRMIVGDTRMGSSTDFAGKRLIVSVGDFHSSVYNANEKFTVNIITDAGIVESFKINCKDTAYFAIDADEKAAFYRVEVLLEDRTEQPIVALGNPIWND